MSIDASEHTPNPVTPPAPAMPTTPSTTPLYEALQATALDSYGSLLSGPLAQQAAVSFADEANTMLETLLADHMQALRDRIDAQLSGMTLGKAPKRKAPKATPVEETNGATNGATNGTPAVAASNGAKLKAVESKPKTDSKGRTIRKRGASRANGRS